MPLGEVEAKPGEVASVENAIEQNISIRPCPAFRAKQGANALQHLSCRHRGSALGTRIQERTSPHLEVVSSLIPILSRISAVPHCTDGRRHIEHDRARHSNWCSGCRHCLPCQPQLTSANDMPLFFKSTTLHGHGMPICQLCWKLSPLTNYSIEDHQDLNAKPNKA
jgi:hypothetical protein